MEEEKTRTTVYLTKKAVSKLKMFALLNEMTMSEAVECGIYKLYKENETIVPKSNPFT